MSSCHWFRRAIAAARAITFLRALHHRHVDHRAFELHRAEALGERRVVGGDHAFGAFHFGRGRGEFLVQHRHLQRMDRAGADEAEPLRAPDDGAECVLVAEVGDRADEADRQNARGARGEQRVLLGIQQTLGIGQHADIGGEVLGPEAERHDARMRLRDRLDAEEAGGRLHQHDELDLSRCEAAFGLRPK